MFKIPFNPPATIKHNLTGQQFGRLTVYSIYAKHKSHEHWLCRCRCGTWKVLRGSHLTTGAVLSCKCLLREHIKNMATTHGHTVNSHVPSEYHSYAHAKARCTNPSDSGYPNYGGRGIKFCFESFEQFLQHIGQRPTPNHSLDRIDNEGHYKIGNVHWATRHEQALNRRSNHLITYQGRTLPMSQWCNIVHIPYKILHQRINKLHWDINDAMTRPVRQLRPRHPKKTIVLE